MRVQELMSLLYLFTSLQHIFFLPGMSNAGDTIYPPQSLSDGETLVSKGGSFELGFFSPGISQKRYLGIWYKNIPVKTVIWVANRAAPISDSSGVLRVNLAAASMELLSRPEDNIVWSSSSSTKKPMKKPIAQLLQSGNLVLRDENDEDPENYLWQSFDYPSDTLLQGMKLGWDSKTGLNRRLSSWKSPDDPAPGELMHEMRHNNYPEAFVWRGSTKFYRTGPWNGIRFSGSRELHPSPVFDYYFAFNQEEVYFTYRLKNNSVVSISVLNQTTYSRHRYIWVPYHQTWEVYTFTPRDYCDIYGQCGANGICIFSESPICQCLKGFKPKSPDWWSLRDWSQGCVRNEPLMCQSGDGFAKFERLKLPDTTNTWVDTNMGLEDCRSKCLANCSCTAYANSDIRGKGSGCVLWFGDLMDIRQSPYGQELFVRMRASELERGDRKGLTMKRASVAVAAAAFVSGVLITSYCIWNSKTNLTVKTRKGVKIPNDEEQEEGLELPCFSFATIANATSNFSANNKLGEGGFGSVYKGTLASGQQFAVKRLSMNSKQGLEELKNEVTLIAKLQHRNLVKLLGCCLEGEEMMLIYEYMPNKSLDSFIFDNTRGKLLKWHKRFQIICGIARGLLYLHQDSRLRIIHRDLKASNVLLDGEMNPKISDFGLSRSFGNEETAVITERVVGTYGYMSPEYAVNGLFSIKSDVFSFGVLLLEIVGGEKNRGFHHPSHSLNLIGHAWKLWKEGRPLDFVNAVYEDACPSDVLRCIHLGLLCVQQRPEDRPNMSTVVLMLVSDIPMPESKKPGFFMDMNPFEGADSSSSKDKPASANKISITTLEGR